MNKVKSKSKTKWVFVRYQDNWADEMDVETIWICPLSVWEKWKERVSKAITTSQEIYFGTNEYITVDNGEQVVKACSVRSIPEAQAKVLIKWFKPSYEKNPKSLTFGQIDVFMSLAERVAEAEEEAQLDAEEGSIKR